MAKVLNIDPVDEVAVPIPVKKTYSGTITAKCRFCNGTGKKPDVLPEEDCIYCSGTGAISLGSISLAED